MLNYEYPPVGGGAGRAHYHLLNQYATYDDLRVDVLTVSATSHFCIESVSETMRLYRIGVHKKNLHYWHKKEIVEWLFKARRHYRTLIRENDYDLIHAFFAFPSAYLCLDNVTEIPYLISLRGSDVPGFNERLKLDYILLSRLFRRIWKNAAAVIANSRGLAELARHFEPSLHYGVIPNGVDTTLFTPPPQRTLDGRIKLLTVCRLIARKQIHILIETIERLMRQGIDVELNIVGDGKLKAKLQAFASHCGVTDRVHFHGMMDYPALADCYRENDLFVISSAHEGMSNAMLEAMASGLPIITTPCEGTAELLGDNGVLVPTPEADGFAQAVSGVIQDRTRYAAMADRSRKTALQFSWKKTAEAYKAVYDGIIQAAKTI